MPRSRPGVGRRSLRFLERELREAEAAARSTLAKGGVRPAYWYRRLHGQFTRRARHLREILGVVRRAG